MDKNNILELLKGGLIVSCQSESEKGSQLVNSNDIARMAKESLNFGACAVRVCGVENALETRKQNPEAIIIGITKDRYDDGRVLITGNLESIRGLVNAGVDIIGLDMTSRLRPQGYSSVDLLKKAKKEFPNVLFMADLATLFEAKSAIDVGIDFLGTTLSGYTPDTESRLKFNRWYEYDPDFDLVKDFVKTFPNFPIIAEGRYRTPEQCFRAIHDIKAFAVCVGSQITRPREIVKWHVKAIKDGGWKF